MADEVQVHPKAMLEWTQDFQKFEKNFRDDTDDYIEGTHPHYNGTQLGIRDYLDTIKIDGFGRELPEFTYFAAAVRSYVGDGTSGILGYREVVMDGLKSYRKGVEVAASAYGGHEEYSRKELAKVDKEILEKLGITVVDEPGLTPDSVTVTGLGGVAGRDRVKPAGGTPPSGPYDWESIPYPEVVDTVMSIVDEPITHIATALAWISLSLFDYGRKLKSLIDLLDSHAKWTGDAHDRLREQAYTTASNLQAWNEGVKSLEQKLRSVALTVSESRRKTMAELDALHDRLVDLADETNARLRAGKPIGVTNEQLINDYNVKVTTEMNASGRRIAKFGLEMSVSVVGENSKWEPPASYQGLMLDAVTKPQLPSSPTSRPKIPGGGPTGPGAGPAAGPSVQPPKTNNQKPPKDKWAPGEGWLPGPPIDPNDIAAALAAALAAAAAAAAKDPKNHNANTPDDQEARVERIKPGDSNPFGTNGNANLGTGGTTDNGGANNGTGGVTPPSIPGNLGGNAGNTGGVAVPTIPVIPTVPGTGNGSTNGSGSTNGGGGGGGGVTPPTVPGTGNGTNPGGGGGGGTPGGVTVPITPGSGTGNNANATRPDWWDDNPWDNPDSPVSLDGRNAAHPGGGGGGGGGTPVSPIPAGDAGATTNAGASTIGSTAAAAGAEQAPYLPPMMPPSAGGGGGGGGGGPRPVRRGGPKLVDPGVGAGPAALSGRGRDATADKPKVVSTEAEGWTAQPEAETEQPVTRIFGRA
ncbi:hypothetical protein AB0H43_23415 [Hamadaea sp. NPDC050747]|uniref:hypothetical protein n=1 Tax=Hamadaea sp. NPDC050747 TaxID=3155789 RepID=UPI00340C6F3B